MPAVSVPQPEDSIHVLIDRAQEIGVCINIIIIIALILVDVIFYNRHMFYHVG